MINLIKTPQRADKNIKYEIFGDLLKVIYNNELIEIFDFTGLTEGMAEEILAETLPQIMLFLQNCKT